MPEDIKNNPLRWDAAVRTESLSWSIIRQIREALFSGKLKPGDFLGSEITLAQQFGVSRMAALRSLSAMGIVEIRMGSRGGAWVTTGNPERMVDAMAIQLRLIGVSSVELLEAQGAMSVVAAELAAGRATDEDVKRMRLAALATEDAGDDPQAFTTLSLRFHESVVEASQNRVLVAQFRALETVLGPLLVANTNPAVARRVIKSNTALLNAIVASDVEAAGRVMRERVVAIRAKLLGAVSAAANGSVPKPSSTAGGAAPRLAPK